MKLKAFQIITLLHPKMKRMKPRPRLEVSSQSEIHAKVLDEIISITDEAYTPSRTLHLQLHEAKRLRDFLTKAIDYLEQEQG